MEAELTGLEEGYHEERVKESLKVLTLEERICSVDTNLTYRWGSAGNQAHLKKAKTNT